MNKDNDYDELMKNENLLNVISYDTLKMSVGILIKDFHHNSKYNLKPIDNGALLYIAIFPNKPMCFYSEKLNIEKGSFNYIAKKIEDMGLANIITDEKDKRKKIFVLTDEGKEEVLATRKELNSHIEKKLSVLSDEDREIFNRSMLNLREIAKKIKNKEINNE
ncbi:MAG: MarR family winged helix-turn-helix transcriptional regulator [Lachnospirales bacterium]